MRIRTITFTSSLALVAIACGAGGARDASPYALDARLGVYDDGSGRAGLAAIATLRDAAGAWPAHPWSVSVRHADGALATFEYAAAGPGSYVAAWFPAVAPGPGAWELAAAGGGDDARASVSLADTAGLALPAPELASDASLIEWAPIAGAATYICQVWSGGSLVLETRQAAPSCDVSGLPPGAYGASVLALSVDLDAVAQSRADRPLESAAFHVSEARLGFTRTNGGADAAVLRAAAGAYDDGIGERSLAVWISIVAPVGDTPTAVAWDVEVVGPNLPPSAPLAFTYWANFPRLMAWVPGVPATPGVYTLTARSTGGTATTTIALGAPEWLDLPLGATATAAAQGGASVEWLPVAGARAYLASAYDGDTGALVASQWQAGASAQFPAGTFEAGRRYDVFVAATDADMLGGALPTQVAVAENVFEYASFTAR